MSLKPYIQIARPDHWFKNIFMIPGIFLVIFFEPDFRPHINWIKLLLGFVSACLVASSNYVINEVLDAEKDKFHPEKKHRPIPSGLVKIPIAYAEWLVLAVIGVGVGLLVSIPFCLSVFLLWVMGLFYNVPPLRMKNKPYLDVLCESVNNPIRMAMGWYATGFGVGEGLVLSYFPTMSVLMAYWMFGAFLMATKRFAEYRQIGNPEQAAQYRASFGYYNDERLLESILFYCSLFAMFSGVFIARYRMELVLATPLVCLCIAYYLHLGFKENSPVQTPESLYKARKLMLLVTLAFAACVVLLFVDIPAFRDTFRAWGTMSQPGSG
jgi:4-hydroxybenzoate polyprenyltransferase